MRMLPLLDLVLSFACPSSSWLLLSCVELSAEELVLKDINNPPKGCQDKDGVMHAFGSEWVKDCSCSTEGIACCNKMPYSVDVPLECELVVNKEACSAKMVLKSDPTKECKLNKP